jgi:hypothetical protein
LLVDHTEKVTANICRPHVFQTKNNDAWQPPSAGREQFAKVKIMSQENAVFSPRFFQNIAIGQAVKTLIH